MILRKPYAFFIKNFKFIHVILTILMGYFMFLSTKPFIFLRQYIRSEHVVANADLTGVLYSNLTFILPFLIIGIIALVLSVMLVKNKPIVFYISLVLNTIVQFIMIQVSYNLIKQMETELLDIRTIRFVTDILSIAIVVQGIFVMLTLVRAIGFDIKKFNFGEDLEDLEIDESDREEFEVNLDFDSSIMKRGVRRRIRLFKYFYHENKFIIYLVSLVITALSLTIVYLNTSIYNKAFDEKVAFKTSEYTMMVKNSYITKLDKSGDMVATKGKTIVAINLSLKTNTFRERLFETARLSLKLGDFSFSPVYRYENEINDLGIVYNKQSITNKFKDYIVVFEIPDYMLSDRAILTFVDNISGTTPKSIKVKVNPVNIDSPEFVKTTNLKEELFFKESNLLDTSMIIETFEIKDEFKIAYDFCYKEQCIKSYEYINSEVTSRDQKNVLHINGTIKWNEDSVVPKETNLIKFINTYGEVRYVLDGKEKVFSDDLKEITVRNAKFKNNYYIEVKKELLLAEKIEIIIKNRNFMYKYVVK